MPRFAIVLAVVLGLSLALAGCESSDNSTDGDQTFKVKLETSVGDILVLVHPEWAPRGAKRFRQLVEEKYFDGCRFFRVVPGFIVQFGLNGDPAVTQKWNSRTLMDEPVLTTNARGTLTYAKAGPNTRTTQLFINLEDNATLDPQGFSPFAEVVEGMENVEKITAKYGEAPDQGQLQTDGNAYLSRRFPDLDYIVRATIVE